MKGGWSSTPPQAQTVRLEEAQRAQQMTNVTQKELQQAFGQWLGRAPWDFWITLTFWCGWSPKRAERYIRQFVSKYAQAEASSFFWVIGYGWTGGLTHIHLLVRGPFERQRAIAEWKQRCGKVHVEAYNAELGGATYYIGRHCTDDRAEYDFAFSEETKKCLQAAAEKGRPVGTESPVRPQPGGERYGRGTAQD